jgi:nucleotide-binding universal stress UspA family protein
VGFDGSPSGAAALARAAALAERSHATLDVITAWHYPIAYGGYPITSNWSPHEDAKDTLRAGLLHQFGQVTPEWVSGRATEGQPARVLIEASDGAEMLVVGSRGHGGFAGLLLGSVSSACAEHAACPVLIMHGTPSETKAEQTNEQPLEAALPR